MQSVKGLCWGVKYGIGGIHVRIQKWLESHLYFTQRASANQEKKKVTIEVEKDGNRKSMERSFE